MNSMTPRDYFAAMAMQAMLTNSPKLVKLLCEEPTSFTPRGESLAEGAYEMADAMMEARK